MCCIFIQCLPGADAASAIPFPRSCQRGPLGPRLWPQWLLAGPFLGPWVVGPKARPPVVVHGSRRGARAVDEGDLGAWMLAPRVCE